MEKWKKSMYPMEGLWTASTKRTISVKITISDKIYIMLMDPANS